MRFYETQPRFDKKRSFSTDSTNRVKKRFSRTKIVAICKEKRTWIRWVFENTNRSSLNFDGLKILETHYRLQTAVAFVGRKKNESFSTNVERSSKIFDGADDRGSTEVGSSNFPEIRRI